MSNLIRVSLDPLRCSRKPKHLAGRITNRIANYPESLSVQELAYAVSAPESRTWCPGVFTGKRSKKHWRFSQILALDFDKGFRFEDALARCRAYGLTPAFAYESFSSTSVLQKYRMIFVLPVEITDDRIYDFLLGACHELFEEADQSCNDRSRMFYGGKSLIYSDFDARLDIMSLVRGLTQFVYVRAQKNASRDLGRLWDRLGIEHRNGIALVKEIRSDEFDHLVEEYEDEDGGVQQCAPHTNGRNQHRCIKGINRLALDSSILTFSFSPTPTREQVGGATPRKRDTDSRQFPERRLVRGIDWACLETSCPALQKFLDATFRFGHHAVFGLATNLLYLEGGETRLLKGLKARGEDLVKYRLMIREIKVLDYKPTRYARYCAEAEEITGATNLVEYAKHERGIIRIVEPMPTISLEEAEPRFAESFQTILNDPEIKIALIKAPTGIGKTRMYSRLDVPGMTVAMTTHSLKDQVAEEMRGNGLTVASTPALPEGLPPEHANAIERTRRAGAHNKAMAYIREIAKTNREVRAYLEALDEATRDPDAVVLTTHERLLYLNRNHRLLIVDEDILPTLLKQGSVKVRDIEKFIDSLEEDATVVDPEEKAKIIESLQSILDSKVDVLGLTPEVSLDRRMAVEALAVSADIGSSVLGLLDSTAYLKMGKTVFFVARRELPEADKIIILSATASPVMCRRLLGDELKVVVLGAVETRGRLIQYPQWSMSRHSLTAYPKYLERARAIIREEIGDAPVVTYKGWVTESSGDSKWFGNLVGLNDLTGRSIAVVGTPHLHPSVYRLYAAALEMPGAPNTPEMKMTLVKRNGYQFWFMTFEDPDLQQIQMDLIESELVQAVGRARLLRYDCTVVLLSNYPVPGGGVQVPVSGGDSRTGSVKDEGAARSLGVCR